MKKKLKNFLIICWLLLIFWYVLIWLIKNNDSKDIVISVNVTAANQTLKINKYFANSYVVDWWDWSKIQKKWIKEIDYDWGNREYWTHKYKKRWTYTVRLSLSPWAYRWEFSCNSSSLIPEYWTTVSDVKILSMPSLVDGFWDSATNPWDCFFSYFNSEWIITSLPEWSFDTSNITIAGRCFFCWFNHHSAANRYLWLTSLPEWSFDTSNIMIADDNFFTEFNENWWIKKLPEWSFDLSKITKVWWRFFAYFNANWALTSLPGWSFDISNIITVGTSFFDWFNYNWAITSLPEWSFNISNIRERWKSFFWSFNWNQWALKDVPDFLSMRKKQVGEEISYDKNSKTNIVINIKVVQPNQKIMVSKYFANEFIVDWWDGLLELLVEDTIHIYEKTWTYDIILSLREWTWRWTFSSVQKPLIPKNYTTITGVKIVSMPSLAEWFWDGPTEPWNNFFRYFNYNWAITSLPEWSFDTSNIKVAWEYFFAHFNNGWLLTSLPEWSFNVSNIEKTWMLFLAWFNWRWSQNSLLESFTSWSGENVKQESENNRVDACVNKIKEYIWKNPIEIFTGNQSSWQIKCHTTPLLITGEYYLQQTCEDNQQLCWLLCYNSWSDIIEHFATCGFDIDDGKLINFYRDNQNNKTGLFDSWDKRFSTLEGRIWLCNQCSGLPEWKTWDWFQEIVASNSYIYNAWQETYNRTQCQIYFDGSKVTVGNKECSLWGGLVNNIWWTGVAKGNDSSKGKSSSCVEDIKEHIRKNLGISGNIVEVVYNSSNAPRGTELILLTGYYYIVRDYGRMGWALYYKDAWIIIKHEDMSCEYNWDGELIKFNYNPDKTDFLKKLWDDRYLTTEGRMSLCNQKTKKNRTMEILKPDYYSYVEIESRWITSWSWKIECRVHFNDGKIEIIDHMKELNNLVIYPD